MRAHFHQDTAGRPFLNLLIEAAARQSTLPELPELLALTAAERQIAIETWRGRMVNEHLSANVWATLVGQLMAAAAPPALMAEAAAAAADELRHAEQCAAVVLALGGEPVATLPPLEQVPTHSDAGPLEAVVRNLLSVGCLSETIAVSIIRAEQAELDGSGLGLVLDQILADEVSHARMGWRALGLLLPRLDAAARARLNLYLVDALAHQVEHEVPRLPLLSAASDSLAASGVCDGRFARSLFLDTIETVIVPGLVRAGLDGTGAWNKAQRRAAKLVAACRVAA
jgi:hypothetical protein